MSHNIFEHVLTQWFDTKKKFSDTLAAKIMEMTDLPQQGSLLDSLFLFTFWFALDEPINAAYF